MHFMAFLEFRDQEKKYLHMEKIFLVENFRDPGKNYLLVENFRYHLKKIFACLKLP